MDPGEAKGEAGRSRSDSNALYGLQIGNCSRACGGLVVPVRDYGICEFYFRGGEARRDRAISSGDRDSMSLVEAGSGRIRAIAWPVGLSVMRMSAIDNR